MAIFLVCVDKMVSNLLIDGQQ